MGPPGTVIDLDAIAFGPDGLVPTIVVDEAGEVLMLAYMDREALARTVAERRTWFYSRSRRSYWAKGETSGARQEVLSIRADCDGDALLVRVRQLGSGACHLGTWSCFTHPIGADEERG